MSPRLLQTLMGIPSGPICLINVSYKLITKALSIRLGDVVTQVVSELQIGFIKGIYIYILDGVVILHEIIHEVKKKKQNGVLFKMDIEKAYDKVNWTFFHQLHVKKWFGDIWCDWMMKVVRGGRVAIRMNDKEGPYFRIHKGVRQGDPLSPLLFNIVADGLALMIKKAQDEGLIKGLIPNLVDGGVVML
jgi:hypothetical protein